MKLTLARLKRWWNREDEIPVYRSPRPCRCGERFRTDAKFCHKCGRDREGRAPVTYNFSADISAAAREHNAALDEMLKLFGNFHDARRPGEWSSVEWTTTNPTPGKW